MYDRTCMCVCPCVNVFVSALAHAFLCAIVGLFVCACVRASLRESERGRERERERERESVCVCACARSCISLFVCARMRECVRARACDTCMCVRAGVLPLSFSLSPFPPAPRQSARARCCRTCHAALFGCKCLVCACVHARAHASVAQTVGARAHGCFQVQLIDLASFLARHGLVFLQSFEMPFLHRMKTV